MKIAFFTLGCKVNQYETDLMMKKFVEAGYILCDFNEKVDVYVINSCSVTNLSTRKTRQYLSRAKKQGGITVLAGCYAQEIENEEALINADIIIGNEEKNDIVEIVTEYLNNSNKKVIYEVGKINEVKKYKQSTSLFKGREVRESIKIEDGCDNFCTYCIIPHVRGRVRSRNIEDIILEIKSLVKNGVGEIILVGIEIASYGKDLDNSITMIDVIERISNIENLKRIRLGSIEPRILTDENIDRIARIEKLCPHFHISVQNLDNNILKRMNRHYDYEYLLSVVNKLRMNFKNPAITCDIIVGFPGETDEEFENTINRVKEIEFYEIHTFKYSKRKWTLAAKMDGQVDGNIAQERSEKLIKLANKQKLEYMRKELGNTSKVLIESQKDGYVYGYTPNYIMVKSKGNGDLIGKEIEIKMVSLDGDLILGEI